MLEQTVGAYLGQYQGLRQELSLEQRQEIINGYRTEDLARYTSVTKSLTGVEQKLAAICPHCEYQLKPFEIFRGFLADPVDTTTLCPRCKKRIEASTIIGGDSSKAYVFMCGEQTIHALREGDFVEVAPAKIKEMHPSLYYSAIFHFGSIENALRQINSRYAYRDEADLAWHTKARPFLGKISDRDIAAVLNVPVRTIAELRKGLHVPAARGRRILPSLMHFVPQ